MILHLDMDAFFASVEQLDNPALRGRPVVVGGGPRGVVATASYEARKFGIHSAMPAATARKLCPQAVFVHGRGRRYAQLSALVMACLGEFSPLVQPASIDEAYVDLAHISGDMLGIARAIKKRVGEVTGGLTCSVGIAPIKFLAKICSDINKPDGIFILQPGEADSFLLSLDASRLPGVGRRMSESLRAIGITRVAQIRRLSRDFLLERYGKWGGQLHDRAFGIDPRTVHPNPPAQSESSEHTFDQDVRDLAFLEKTLLAQAERVGQSLRKNGAAGRTVTLKIKFADFRQITRSRTLASRVNSTRAIHETACALLRQTPLPMAVRLIGVGVSGFGGRQEQFWLPGLDPGRRDLDLDKTLDAIRERFGRQIIRRGD